MHTHTIFIYIYIYMFIPYILYIYMYICTGDYRIRKFHNYSLFYHKLNTLMF